MKKPVLHILLLLLMASSLLSACGFHLRGHTPQDNGLTGFAISGKNRFDGVAAELQRLAISRNISIDPQAQWRISLSDETVQQWRASSTQSYSRNEYWLSVAVILSIRHETLEYHPIALKREALFQDNSDQLNSKSREKELITQELRQQLAQDILQQLSHLAANPPDCDCDDAEKLQ